MVIRYWNLRNARKNRRRKIGRVRRKIGCGKCLKERGNCGLNKSRIRKD
jgi:hypothetical protein